MSDDQRVQLAQNFYLDEWACHDGTPVPAGLIGNARRCATNLQVLRDYLKRPIVLLSGFRTVPWNLHVSGEPGSQHLIAAAADIAVAGVAPTRVADTIEHLIGQGKMEDGGLGRYANFTHYDCVRGTRKRWHG